MTTYLRCGSCNHCWKIVGGSVKVNGCIVCNHKRLQLEMGSAKAPSWFNESKPENKQ